MTERTRTYTWEDPLASFAEGEEGRVVFEMTPQEHHYNPIGSVR